MLTLVMAVLVITVVGAGIGIGAIVVGLARNRPLPATQASRGQCIQDPEGKEADKVYMADCESANAAYMVTAEAGTDCKTVEGTTTTFQGLCLIGLDEEPSRSLVAVQAGDCLSIETTSEEATVSECTSGTYPVLLVLNNVSYFDLSTLAGMRPEGDACSAAQ
ncbi:hypothetical protein [Actinomyces sp.]|uniref:hypothetical protein n=1 Tax=Actinomyces sp. TaxID=29317 RepID=UPI0026DC8D4B|nr:hypothetical protein [Actinomyces sp.]MDO4899335.1 hypothetical protein [Actinomyces sp.]